MTPALLLIALLLVVAGLIGLVLPGLPGTPLVLAGIVLAAWSDGFARIGWPALLVCAALAGLAQAADFLGVALGAKRFGGSRWGMAGALVGALAGLPFGLLGVIVGPFVGAVLLELLGARKAQDQALRAGAGTVIGLALAAAVKFALVGMMLGIALVAWIW